MNGYNRRCDNNLYFCYILLLVIFFFFKGYFEIEVIGIMLGVDGIRKE